MINTLIISNIVSWIAIIILFFMLIALVRQVGLIHERISPTGALAIEKKKLTIGQPAPSFELNSINGGRVKIGGDHSTEKSTLLFFLSDTCPVCKTLLPTLTSIAKHEKNTLNIVLASDGAKEDHLKLVEREELQQYAYVLSTELGMAYEIGKLPYGVLLDNNGTLISHGLTNTREHIESLLEAERLGVPDVQTYYAENAS